MISRLRGIVLEKLPPLALLEIGGVGYEVHMPITCFPELPDIGQEAIIFTQFIMRENVQILYGFKNKQERMLFRELIKINGIGPKLALIILSSMSTQQFINIIKQEDLSRLVNLPGIGKKTAERLIIEMRGRFNNLHNNLSNQTGNLMLTASSGMPLAENVKKEAIAALIALGYKPQEVSQMVNKVTTPNDSSETLIRKALCSTL